jgi:DNA-binding CsgD family transcriptional regulator
MELLADLAFTSGRQARAIRLLGAADTLRVTVGTPAGLDARTKREKWLVIARESLGEDTFQQTWEAGQAMPLDAAIAYALEPDEAAHDETDTHALPLSSREVEVLRLLVAGLTNKEIAEALFISPHTVANHVANILNKLGLDSRSAAVAWAVRQGIA